MKLFNKFYIFIVSFVFAFANIPVFASSLTGADYVYVNGTRITLSDESFVNIGGQKYVATVPVEGDVGRDLIFDIDAKIKGDGYYDLGFKCYARGWQIGELEPGIRDLLFPWYPPCPIGYAVPGDNFYFSIRMDVTCSDFIIGTESANRNTLLTSEQKSAIAKSVDRKWGKVIGNPYERTRELNLLIDNYLNTEGACKELRIEIEGLNGTQISEIVGDILIAEDF
ncbi:hypothetical protein ACJJH9_02995 [Microbulbifer sp. DLAB2-AF]|uniref:hypothetical protein n=1 Tax=Microbulbifer sp. DLAB2-AF TaxID=3243395 RepID=UPI00403A7047